MTLTYKRFRSGRIEQPRQVSTSKVI